MQTCSERRRDDFTQGAEIPENYIDGGNLIPNVTGVSTIGTTLSWAVEATAGTRPTTGYTAIPNITSIPEDNPSPKTLDTTPLTELHQKTSIPGLKEAASVMTINANDTDDLRDGWDALVTAAEALTGGKKVWLCVQTPNLTKATYIPGMPAKRGSDSYEVDSVLKAKLYFTPMGEPEFAAAPTSGGNT